MTKVASVVLGILGAGALVGCSSAGSGTSGPEGSASPVCPGCRPTAGGETSDFGGGQENCRETEQPLSAADREALQVDALLAAASAPLELPLRWQAGDTAEEPTTLNATIELGSVRYFAIGTEVSNACRDAVRVPATIVLETEDGGLAATLEGTLRQRRGDSTWELRASVDLSLVTGNRDLAIDTSRPHIGRLQLAVHGFPGERRGELRPEILYVDETWVGSSFEAALVFQGGNASTPWTGQFPGDACGASAIPLEAEQTHPFLADQTVQEVYDRARADVPAASPASSRAGTWNEVFVDIAPTLTSVCLTDSFGSPSLSIRGAARIRSEDGSFDLGIDRLQLGLAGTSGAPASLILSNTFEARPPEDLARAMGIRGVDLSGHESVLGEVRADYEWTPNGLEWFGRVSVRDALTSEELEYLTWPSGDQAPGESL